MEEEYSRKGPKVSVLDIFKEQWGDQRAGMKQTKGRVVEAVARDTVGRLDYIESSGPL